MKSISKIKLVYVLIILVLVSLILIFSFKAYSNYLLLRNHRAYFRQPDQRIEPWMTVHQIIDRFHISNDTLYNELNLTNSPINERLTIDSICKQKHLDCIGILNKLNSQIK
jgi:hypothetical protein